MEWYREREREIERIKNSKENQFGNTNGHNNVFDVLKSQIITTQQSVAMQASPTSVSSNGSSANGASNSINAQIIAQVGLDTIGKDGGGGGDGDDNRISNHMDDGSEHNQIGKGGARKNEFILVNPRNITINMFTGRNLHSNLYMPFSNSIRRFILVQGSDGQVLLKLLGKVDTIGINKHTNEELR